MKFSVIIDINQKVLDAMLYQQLNDALAVASEHILSSGLTGKAGRGEVKDLDGNVLGTWAATAANEQPGKVIMQGAEGQQREFIITSGFAVTGNAMEFTATAADADVDYRMTIERVS